MTELKAALRRELKNKRDSLLDSLEEKSRRICELCLSLEELKAARTLLLYCAKGSEADLSALHEWARERGVTVGYPRCTGEGIMEFRCIGSLDELESGRYGIKEPTDRAPLCETRGAVCFVPALAFDEDGFRLGYGGGYYDRFLSCFEGISVGVTVDALLQKRLPRGVYDQKTDYIITESKVKRTVES